MSKRNRSILYSPEHGSFSGVAAQTRVPTANGLVYSEEALLAMANALGDRAALGRALVHLQSPGKPPEFTTVCARVKHVEIVPTDPADPTQGSSLLLTAQLLDKELANSKAVDNMREILDAGVAAITTAATGEIETIDGVQTITKVSDVNVFIVLRSDIEPAEDLTASDRTVHCTPNDGRFSGVVAVADVVSANGRVYTRGAIEDIASRLVSRMQLGKVDVYDTNPNDLTCRDHAVAYVVDVAVVGGADVGCRLLLTARLYDNDNGNRMGRLMEYKPFALALGRGAGPDIVLVPAAQLDTWERDHGDPPTTDPEGPGLPQGAARQALLAQYPILRQFLRRDIAITNGHAHPDDREAAAIHRALSGLALRTAANFEILRRAEPAQYAPAELAAGLRQLLDARTTLVRATLPMKDGD